jgi:hypothetical protein
VQDIRHAVVHSNDTCGARAAADQFQFAEAISGMKKSEKLLLPSGNLLRNADAAIDEKMDLITVSFILDDDFVGAEISFSEFVADRGKLLF